MQNNIVEVRGNSLTGVLESGDHIIILPTPDEIKRDMLIVFKENPAQTSIKICKGISGDQLSINTETKEIMVNGKVMDVKFSNDAQIYCWRDWLRFSSKVPEGYLLLLGTTPDAVDSRSRGYFSKEQIVGVATKILKPAVTA